MEVTTIGLDFARPRNGRPASCPFKASESFHASLNLYRGNGVARQNGELSRALMLTPSFTQPKRTLGYEGDN